MFKKLLNKLFGYRWSLYFVRDGNQLIYAMHSNSVLKILGYIINPYLEGKKPISPWSLHLNFNKNHDSFELKSRHFVDSGNNLSPELISKIKSLDKKFYKYTGSKAVFMDMKQNEEIAISNFEMGNSSIGGLQETLDKIKEGEDYSEKDFYSIIREIFE